MIFEVLTAVNIKLKFLDGTSTAWWISTRFTEENVGCSFRVAVQAESVRQLSRYAKEQMDRETETETETEEDWTEWNHEKRHNLYTSPSAVRKMTFRKARTVGMCREWKGEKSSRNSVEKTSRKESAWKA